jgi:DNA polymerase-3 subunit gamma/tau
MARLSAAFGSGAEAPAEMAPVATPTEPASVSVPVAPVVAESGPVTPASEQEAPESAPVASAPVEPAAVASAPVAPASAAAQTSQAEDGRLNHEAWLELFPALGLGGITRNIGAHCLVEHDDGTHLKLRLDPAQSAMMADVHRDRIHDALAGQGVERVLEINIAPLPEGLETPHGRRIRMLGERHVRAVEALRTDPHIKLLEQELGARLLEDSVNSFEPDNF